MLITGFWSHPGCSHLGCSQTDIWGSPLWCERARTPSLPTLPRCVSVHRRLIWSRSPHASAEMFASLKSNQDEPDPAVATLVGVPVGQDGRPAGGAGLAPPESVVNQGAIELLRQLPGVTGEVHLGLDRIGWFGSAQ